MKKILLIILFILFGQIAFSQKLIALGAQYEFQRTWITNVHIDQQETYRNSFGISFCFYGARKVRFESGVYFSNQGMKVNATYSFNGIPGLSSMILNTDYDLHYIKIPALIGLSGDRNKKVYINLNFGPQVSFLTSAKVKIVDTGVYPTNYSGVFDDADRYRKILFDLAVSFGVNLNINTDLCLSAALKGDQSISNIDNSTVYYYDSAQHNRTFGVALTLSYLIPITVSN